MRFIPAATYATSPSRSNGLDKEGDQALSVETLSGIAVSVQDALLQAISPSPGEDEIMFKLPAWPREWDTAFTLLARVGFLVSSACMEGEIPFVRIQSNLGSRLQLRNPWNNDKVYIHRKGGPLETLTGELLSIETSPGESILLTASTAENIDDLRIRLEPGTLEPVRTVKVTLPDGRTISKTIGN